ncbi:50S ribosomal protein L9 [bacterium]|nr:50S ribosomal protein L9 [candidate division CSSED10-310 bacterium]
MKVILRENIKHLGKAGEAVDVADGYGRNFLIPKRLAVLASSGNMAILTHERRMMELRQNKEIKVARDLARRIKKISCTIARQVGENEKLFGSVSAVDIIKCLQGEGMEIDKRQVVLEEPIKTLGIYPVLIRLHPEVEARLKVWVVKA